MNNRNTGTLTSIVSSSTALAIKNFHKANPNQINFLALSSVMHSKPFSFPNLHEIKFADVKYSLAISNYADTQPSVKLSSPSESMPTKDDMNSESFVKEYAEEIVRILAIAGFVAGSLFPLERGLNKMHAQPSINNPSSTQTMGQKISGLKNLRLGMVLASSVELFKLYMLSAKQATYKNAVLAQRGKVDNVLNGQKDSVNATKESTNANKESTSANEEMDQQQAPLQNMPKYVQAGAVAASISLIDTTFTHNASNKRVHANFKYDNKEHVIPQPKTFKDKAKLFGTGFGVRTGRNAVGVAGLLIVPNVKDTLDGYVPHNPYVSTNLLATGLVGYGSGLFQNALDLTYKTTVIKTSLSDAPSSISVARELFAKHGPQVFLTGSKQAALFTTVAYWAVPKAEEIADKVVIPTMEKLAGKVLPEVTAKLSSLSLFSAANKIAEQKITEECYQYPMP